MLRTKITEVGKLSLLDDRGLVCLVTSDEPPPLDPSALRASFFWASPNPSELVIGDLAAHWDYGVARYRGCKSVDTLNAGRTDYLVLEFADSDHYVPAVKSHLIQKLARTTCQLSKLYGKSTKLTRSYCVEALPNAYQWPGVGTFPEFPKEPQRTEKTRRLERITQGKIYRTEQQQAETPFHEAVAKWRSACATYQKALHASPSYQQVAQEYFERQSSEPMPLLDWWSYRAVVPSSRADRTRQRSQSR